MYREIVVRKVRGVSDADAQRRLVGSLTTLGGLLKHLRQVEFDWFHTVLAQRPESDLRLRRCPTIHPMSNSSWRLARRSRPDHRLSDGMRAFSGYRAEFGLDDTAPHRGLGPVSLRWIYIHLIEETARHAGHIDILRELIDGKTGFDDLDR